MAILALVLLTLVIQHPAVLAARYRLTDNWKGSSLWDNFLFESFDDPTHGRVEYVVHRACSTHYLTRLFRLDMWIVTLPRI
jgi:hypothetical protein